MAITNRGKVWLAILAACLLFWLLCFYVARAAFGATPAQEFFAAARAQPGINAYAATCQSAMETGYWQSELWRRAYNGAGIKAPLAWRKSGKPYIRNASPEYSNGKYITRESYFRKYDSLVIFLSDYAQKIAIDYPYSHRHLDNFWLYFAGMYRGRVGNWATDHQYYEKFAQMAVKLAPEILGPAWRAKLLCAYEYAKNELEPWQRDVINKQLREVM